MKDGFAFLYPPPRVVRCGGGFLDIGRTCFPLEIFKKYDFLFEQFSVRNRTQGLEVIFQERPYRSPTRGPGLDAEEYAIECLAERIVLSAASPRGQFYALSTLLQIMAFHEGSGRMPAFTLLDSPEVPVRGFMLPLEPEGFAPLAALRNLLLKLALLKFNHFAMPAGAAGREGLATLSGLARRAGMEIMLLDRDPLAVFRLDSPGTGNRDLPEEPLFFKAGGEDGGAIPDGWFGFFIDQYHAGKARGKRTAAWADVFALRPEWIRKLPQDVLVLNRQAAPERAGPFQAAAMPFRKHHIRQVLCPVLCARGRFIPDTRSGLARAGAAFAAAKAWKLDGVMVAGGEEGDLCLLEGGAMLRFQAGCLLWSGRPPGPSAFSRWAVGRDVPDLFRVYSFLAQAEHRLPHSHCCYLFEDPLSALFSRQGDPREVAAHFQKAALYLKKREIAPNDLTGFTDFVRRLYEFIAIKVGLSIQLEAMLGEKGGGEEVRRLAARLRQGVLELKNAYLELQREYLAAGSLARIVWRFDLLAERFDALSREAYSPATRERLLESLDGDVPLDALGADPGSGW